MKPRIELAGKRFGGFVVVEEAGKDKHSQRVWLCLCDCGVHFTRTGSNILAVNRGTAAGRGCLQCGYAAVAKARTKHGFGGRRNGRDRLYALWSQMKNRCDNPNVDNWLYYGFKGIKICAAWRDFAVFRKWALDNGYALGLTIDRLDSSGDYEPSNCAWVTMQENRRRMHESKGHKMAALH